MNNRRDITKGTRYGMLTILDEAERLRLPSGQTNRAFRCICDCGNLTTVRLVHLTHGRIKSCGCLSGDKHGASNTKLYRVWNGMKCRCSSDKSISRKFYKEKGITVCENWLNSFTEFQKWSLENGYKEGLVIDRINGDGNYEPDNCRWTTPLINGNNLSSNILVIHNGKEIALGLAVRELGLLQHFDSIRSRLKRGWSFTSATTIPFRSRGGRLPDMLNRNL